VNLKEILKWIAVKLTDQRSAQTRVRVRERREGGRAEEEGEVPGERSRD
jgi:hypothetical protein